VPTSASSFTEYTTTLDYVLRRLRERYDQERILTMYGGMDEDERDRIKQAFNDPAEPVRVLLATDAASEGLNLQRTARYLLHYDCPWNPSKLEQRNGRLDRHGQARDVQVFHFMTDADQDLRFLAHVIAKADEIREDLGSVNELFDEAAHRRLVDGESASSVQADLDKRIVLAQGRASIEADDDVVATAGVSITRAATTA
jgi:SNF2 family DNA or RNA helicase